MGRLSKLRVVDPVLSALALGYSNAEFIGDQLLPFVTLDKEGGKIPRFGKDMAYWRVLLFATMFRNASSLTAFFKIPSNRVVELGSQVVL